MQITIVRIEQGHPIYLHGQALQCIDVNKLRNEGAVLNFEETANGLLLRYKGSPGKPDKTVLLPWARIDQVEYAPELTPVKGGKSVA